MTLDEIAQIFIDDFMTDSLSFKTKIISNIDAEGLEKLEKILLEKIPKLIITHSDTDTDDDIRMQLSRIEQIIDSGNYPYFIDFSHSSSSSISRSKKLVRTY